MAPIAAIKNPIINLTDKPKNKKIIFNDEDESHVVKAVKNQKQQNVKENVTEKPSVEEEEEDIFAKRERQKQQKQQQLHKIAEEDAQKKWYQVYPQYDNNNSNEEVLDLKETEQLELYNLCKTSFESEKSAFNKRNPTDVRWLQTALHKGTAKDRANAGALLVTSNALGNLEALTNLVGCTKLSNKSSTDVVHILTELWKEVLLPPNRKLIAIQNRGAVWKLMRKNKYNLTKEIQKRIYAYWYFENELKDTYFEFLKNLQQCIQIGQENNKNVAIIAASDLLRFAPEKEQMLLTMLINKLGDPIAKIASKALHHLNEVAHHHPNMCGVIAIEAEKLLFRNNISDRAQHFTLCFLASIAHSATPEVCTKLVHICFSLFKILVQKGAVNNRTMQAILRCLQKAIVDAKPAKGSTEILSKEMQDTIYRLVHLADIRVAVQTLGLLLQLITVKTEKSDRFYNALYKKMLDIELTTIGIKTTSQLLHIIHRAIHIDNNVQRAKAFIKRLLQISLYMPTQTTAGCLIVIHKLLRSRKELFFDTETTLTATTTTTNFMQQKITADADEMAKFDDSDGDEKYEDIKDEEYEQNNNEEIKLQNKTQEETKDKNEDEEMKANENTIEIDDSTMFNSSWHHAKVTNNKLKSDEKVRELVASKYDPYYRVPAYAGAEFSLMNELILLCQHFHPTVQVFSDNILNGKRIDYYGDPLRDFGLPHFLERFAFKNPKKIEQKAEVPTQTHKRYVSFGARGKPVKQLTAINCTEDERYIFNFLEQKRKIADKVKPINKNDKKTTDGVVDEEETEDFELKAGEIDDDEFNDYLDGYFGKKSNKKKLSKKGDADDDDDDEELDFLKELSGELKDDEAKAQKTKKKQKQKQIKKKNGESADAENEVEMDWGDNDDENEDDGGSIDFENEDENDSDDAGSISLEEADDDDGDDDDDDLENFVDDDDESDFDNDDDDEDLMPSKAKKSRKVHDKYMNDKNFSKKLKHTGDMSSLFAAADDFAQLLENAGDGSKGHGTSNAVFNKDKSSAKQMKWEEKRRSNTKTYISKKFKNVVGKKRKN